MCGRRCVRAVRNVRQANRRNRIRLLSAARAAPDQRRFTLLGMPTTLRGRRILLRGTPYFAAHKAYCLCNNRPQCDWRKVMFFLLCRAFRLSEEVLVLQRFCLGFSKPILKGATVRLLTKKVGAVSLSVLYPGRELNARIKLMLPKVLAQPTKTT